MSAKNQLLDELRRSRAAISRDVSSVGEELNVIGKIQRSVKSRPLAWLGGAAAIGYMLAGPKTRVVAAKKTSGKEAAKDSKAKTGRFGGMGWIGTIFALLKLVLPVAQPALSAYATRRMAEFAEKISR
jgi:hypothetical protein